MKEFFDTCAKAIACVSFLGLLVSATHEWAYFSIIGSEFQRLASVSDYFSSAVDWLPVSALALFAGLGIELLVSRAEGWMSEDEIVRATPNPAATQKARQRPWKLLTYLAIIFGVVGVIFSPPFLYPFFLGFPMVVLWPQLAGYIFAHANAPVVGRAGLAVIIFFPLILAMAFFVGKSQANSDLVTKAAPHLLQRSGKTEGSVLVLRSFEKGLLIKEPQSNRLEFVRWDEVKNVSSVVPELSMKSNICTVTGLLCLPPFPK